MQNAPCNQNIECVVQYTEYSMHKQYVEYRMHNAYRTQNAECSRQNTKCTMQHPSISWSQANFFMYCILNLIKIEEKII